jgi:uncharacterized membrane protein YkgB
VHSSPFFSYIKDSKKKGERYMPQSKQTKKINAKEEFSAEFVVHQAPKPEDYIQPKRVNK